MLRLSRMTDYGVVVLAHLARARREGAQADAVTTAQGVAEATGLPAASVAKLLKQLARGGLVTARRGAAGGYQLSALPEAITMRQVLAVLEGDQSLVDCVDGMSGACAIEGNCAMRGRWDPVNAALRAALDSVTLADMVAAQGVRPVLAGTVMVAMMPGAGERQRPGEAMLSRPNVG